MAKNRLLTKRRAFLLGLGASVGVGVLAMASKPKQSNNKAQAIIDDKRTFVVNGNAPLRDRAAAKKLIYGASTVFDALFSDSAFARSFLQECAMLVPANELKMAFLRPSLDRFDFTKGDALLSFASSHNLLCRGHTLVWNQDFFIGPEWIRKTVNSKNAEQILTDHIKTVVGHYSGKMHSWDVVNEIIGPNHGRADGLANSPWLEFLGPGYIDLAFRTAAEADPQALLVLNDAEFEYDTPEQEARREAVLKLLERLKSQGTPVHALGIQSHLKGDATQFNPGKLKAFLHDVASLGLKILITEMDVSDNALPKDINVRDRAIAAAYEDYLSVVVEEPAVIAIVTWGLSDHYTWCSMYPREDKAPVRPLPLDEQLKRKLAWNAIARSFDKAPVHSVSK